MLSTAQIHNLATAIVEWLDTDQVGVVASTCRFDLAADNDAALSLNFAGREDVISSADKPAAR